MTTKKERKNYILYYAKGETYNKQAVYSILTLLNVYNKVIPKTFFIVVYTDQPQVFSFLNIAVPIQTILISDKQINTWLNNATYFVRTKICVIHEFLSNNTGKTLFVDTDTVFLKKIDAIFDEINPNNSFLHKKEGNITGKAFKEYMEFFNGKEFTLRTSGRTIRVSPNSCMWNSGVIGLCNSNIGLVKDVLELCDELAKVASFYLNEQFSFSSVLGEVNKLKNAYNYIFHYWPSDYKLEMNAYLSRLLSHHGPQEIDELIKEVQKNRILRTSLMDKTFFHFSPRNFKNFIRYKLPHLLGFQS
jgi:hypothetical protein